MFHCLLCVVALVSFSGIRFKSATFVRYTTSWVDCLQKNLEAFGAVPRKGQGRKWVAFGVVVKDGRDWMTAAKNMGKWHRGVERGAEALDSAWRRADLRQSNVQRQREVNEVVQ